MKIPHLFLVMGVTYFSVYAADATDSGGLSATGKRRVEQNIQIIEQNIKDSQSNVEVSKKNAATLENELKSLDGIEKEYQKLQQNYEAYLAKTKKEVEKNTASLKELEKFEKDLAKGGANAEAQDQLAKAKAEEAERLHWKKETEAKVEKSTKQLNEIHSNLNNIHSRRAPIQKQLETSLKKQREYEKMIEAALKKKAEMQKLVENQPTEE